ncbi:MAG: InlB B-repeat-containing protein [Clostridia bacterium]|nr:InlB B-repeat-containing protein [Clostridia bacterium]
MTKTKRINFRQIGTKAVAFLLAMITFLSVFTWLPMQVSAASADEDSPAYKEFQAQCYAEFFDQIFVGTASSSYANTYLTMLDEDDGLRAIRNTWEAYHMVSEPSYALGKLTDAERYKLVIFDLMLGDMDEKDSILDSLAQGITNDKLQHLASVSQEVLKKINTKNLKNAKVNSTNMSVLQKVAKSTATETTFKAFSAVSNISSVYKNMDELIESYTSYQAISELKDGVEEILSAMAADSNNPRGLRIAATECIVFFNEAFDKILANVVAKKVVYKAVDVAAVLPVAVDYAWDEFIGTTNYSYALLGVKGIRVLANAVFDIDKSNMYYYALGACVDFEKAMIRVMDNAKKTYKASPTLENATYYMQTVEMYKKVVLLGFDYSINLVQHEGTKPGQSESSARLVKELHGFKTVKEDNYKQFENITYNAYEKAHAPSFDEVESNVNKNTAGTGTSTQPVSKDAQKIVDLALSKVGTSYANGYCLRFVRQLFEDAYGFKSTACCAYKYGNSFIDSKSRDDIPLGASVFFGGSSKTCSSCKNKCGHIGIYVGDGYIVHGWSGKIVKTTIDYVVDRGYPYRGWGWHGDKALTFTDYDISSVFCSETTNNSATINVRLNNVATVQKWTYFLSKDKSQVEKVDGTQGSTHKTVAGMDCVRVLDYTNDPQTQTAASFKINRFAKQPLEANTTYYYKATVKIGSKWYESAVYSFTTAKVLPAVPSVNVSSSSLKIGIGDQATLLWDAVDNAESYNIVIKNSSGATVQTKNNITGTTCVLDGFDTADTYTAHIEAVNSAGTTQGLSAAFTVMPNVTVTFYDPIGKKTIDTRTVSYGHSASAPKNPQQEGHTFAKWDKSFDKVTENITVNAVYDVNSYTVKFVDTFTNKVIGSPQTVKYGQSATAPNVTNIPDGYALASWDKSFNNIKSDLTVYTVYKWIDKDHTATVTINSVTRNTTKQGYDVTVTISNKVSEISTGRVVFVLKSQGGVILSTVESSAFAIDALANKTITDTVLCPELAPKIEIYVVNGYENEALGQISKVATQTIDNSTSSGWSGWITYTGNCPMTSGNGITVETQTLSSTSPTKYYYRYKTLSTTTSYSTSMSGWTQNGYSLVNAGSRSVTYVSNWHNGFLTSNSLYSQYNKTPVSAYENATQKVVVDSNEVVGYIYWHWCRGGNHGAINRKINWTKTSTYGTFHAFFSTEKLTYSSSGNAYKYKNTSCCKDTYWWNGAVSGSDNIITVRKQTYTTYNKLYNYYQYSGYTGWIEHSSSNAPIYNGQSAGTNKTYQNVETQIVPGTTTYTHQYRYMTTTNPTINEPSVPSNRVYNLSGNVGSQYAGKAATVWVYKYDQASNENIQYIGTTTVGSDGSINIANAKLISAPTVESGDYTIVASVAGQAKAIKIGVIEAPKPTYTVTFYDFDRTTVLSQQTITAGDSATLPSETLLNVPEGHRFTNWNMSVVNVRENMDVYPECETESYVVAFVNWEKQIVELKEFLYGAELIAEKAPEGKDGYITEWVVQVGNEYLTIKEFHDAGYTVSGNMVVETRSTLEEYTVTIVNANPNSIIDGNAIITNGLDSVDIASEYVVENGNYIDFSSVQMSVEENPNYIFTGWINAHTGEAIDGTIVDENIVIYPSYTFAATTDMPLADIETGEYNEQKTVTLTCTIESATIWYTTDNSDPSTSATAKEYTGPITISESCVLRYCASSLGKNNSCEDYRVYAINANNTDKYHVVTIWSELHDENGSAPAYGLIKSGEKLPVSVFKNMEGYEFEGVFFDAAYENEFACDTNTVTSSVDLYAKYGYASYTVVFVDHDGTELYSQTVDYMRSAHTPLPPHREGYIFVGWDKSYDCITEDTTVSALYIPESENASVSLNESVTLNISIGKSMQLNASVETESSKSYEMVWTSSNEGVVSIDQNGKITANSAGTAVIKVKLPYTGSEASVTVNVLTDEYFAIVLKYASTMGFDSENNLRAIPLGENTVAEIRSHFENENLIFCDAKGKILAEDALVTTGTLIQLYDGTKLIAQTTAIVTGDFNCDGLVSNKDIVMINQYIENARIANKAQMIAIDVNGDGVVNDRDTTILTNYLVNKEALN